MDTGLLNAVHVAGMPRPILIQVLLLMTTFLLDAGLRSHSSLTELASVTPEKQEVCRSEERAEAPV